MSRLRLVIISQQVILRQALACLLATKLGHNIIEEYNSVSEVQVTDDEAKPSLWLVDVHMPKAQIMDLVQHVRTKEERIAIIGCSHSREKLVDLMPLKADGYLTLDLKFDEFMQSLLRIEEGMQVIADSLIPIMVDKMTIGLQDNCIKKFNSLTMREKQVLTLLATGYTNSQIADELTISVYTVKNHVHNVLEKLAIDNRTQLVSYAYAVGLVS